MLEVRMLVGEREASGFDDDDSDDGGNIDDKEQLV